MTAAIYNQGSSWAIPTYIWPAVLGVSVGVHLALLLYGLPDLSTSVDERQDQPETEVVIESGGLEFDQITVVESVATEELKPEVASVVPQASTSLPAQSQTTAAPVSPGSIQTVQPEKPQSELSNVVQPSTVDSVSSAEIAPVPAENVTTQKAVAAPQSVVSVTVSQSVEATTQTVLPSTSTQAVSVIEAVPVEVDGREVADVSETEVVTAITSVGESLQSQQLRPASNSEQVVGVPVASAIDQAQPDETQPVLTTAVPTSSSNTAPIQSINTNVAPMAVAPIAPTIQSTSVPQPISAPSAQVVQSVPGVSASISSPDADGVSVQSGADAVEAIQPLQQQLAAVAPSDIEASSLAPSEPETSNVPSAPIAGEPTLNVGPVEVASIDPLAKVTAYVAGYNAGECSHLTVMAAGPDSAAVTAFGTSIPAFMQFDRRFAADQGYEADIEVRLVTRQQCALLDAPGLLAGVEAPGLVNLDATVVTSGTRVSGVIQRDLPLGRIANAEQVGLELNGKGPPELYVIDDAGQIHDGRRYILPESNAVTAGGWRFSVPVTLISSERQETALVLAIWNRPHENQPPRFGSLPSGHISDVLQKPGVYSLTAFKVSR
ncbi:hypothetical protein [Roseibium sp. SCP14]|uniref:hypothetical protein n=1 Tax=Roseibium sp. SCP14 TaxID=3141375 RepID=UPI003335A3FC